jgi:sterol desaturase/sphingolipid hydroxylase (fatty acid hydroxylase superfamily)
VAALLRSIFFNASSIFFLPFLASGILITIFWLRFSYRKNFKQSVLLLFTPKIWLTKNTAIDLFFSLFILLVLTRIIDPLEAYVFDSAQKLEGFLNAPPTALFVFRLNPVVEGVLATLIAMLAYDFASYAMHRLMHSNSILWRIHAFHHSAPNLTFFTTYRQHPLEPILLAIARSVATALSLVVFHYFFPAQTQVITVLGLGAGFFLYMFTVNLHHSPIPVTYPRLLRTILISPHVHHLHHSAETRHNGKNYGVVFSFWDRWLKTYHDEKVGLNQIKFSLDDLVRNENSLQKQAATVTCSPK